MSDQDEQLLKAYQQTFRSPVGQQVLADLARFCRAAESCAVPGNHDLTLMLLGRNEVFLRISQFASLSLDDVLHLRMGRQPLNPKPEDDDEDR